MRFHIQTAEFNLHSLAQVAEHYWGIQTGKLVHNYLWEMRRGRDH